jgi:hypothetical protein
MSYIPASITLQDHSGGLMMLFRAISSYACIACVALFICSSCSSDDESNPIEATIPAETKISIIDSYSNGEVVTPSGYAIKVMKGCVPETVGQSAAQVTFSVETKIDPPKPLPPGIKRIGNFVKYGPDGFVFRWPLRVSFPYPANMEPVGLGVMFYSVSEDKWVAIPLGMIDLEHNQIHADVMELGYFALVQFYGIGRVGAASTIGGFEFVGPPPYFYSLTVNQVDFTYPPQQQLFSKLVGCMSTSGSDLTGSPMQPAHTVLPQGAYEVFITRTVPGTASTMPRIETYSVPARGTINRPLRRIDASVTDWTMLEMPSGGSWVDDRPSVWLTPSTPMGTSEFQATLTWNTSSSYATDLDLHLYGPNGMHVYWNDKIAMDNSFELDVDWLKEPYGHAAENIYSKGVIPAGHYTLFVKHYSGVRKAYSVRVIRGGTVKTTTGLLEIGEEHTIVEFDVN